MMALADLGKTSVALVLAVASNAAHAVILDDLEFKHGIAFFQDLKYPAGFTHLDYLNPDAPKGGELVLATQSAFNNLAPMATRGISAPDGFWFTSDTLLLRAGDEVSAFYGRLADGIAVADDGMFMAFRIHADARWRDGVPVTASDVAYTLNSLRNQIEGRMYYSFIGDVEVLDDRHVVVHLHSPITLNNVIMVQFTSILPEHYWRDRDPSASTLDPPLTSGPYRVSAIKQGRFIEYERDPDYWGRDIPVNRGRYNFAKVRFDVYRDATVIRESFRKGLIDIWTETDIRYWHDSFDTPAFAKGWVKKIRRHFGIEVGVRSNIALNNRRAKFNDRRVREALTLAMDFDWQNRTLHMGHHKRAHSFWPDTILAATGLPSDAELALLERFRDQLPSELFDRPFRFPETTSVDDHRENLVRARQLLSEAGWRAVDGVLTDAAGEPFTIEFLSQNVADSRILLPYLQDLKRLGIAATIRLVESSQYINLRRDFDFDAVLQNQDILMPPVIELEATYHSEAAKDPVSRNVAGIGHPVLDYLITQANLATTLEEMTAACRAIDRVLLWQYYQIPLYAVDLRRTVHWDKFGIPDFEAKYWPAFPDGWWYDDAKAARILNR
ncbi:MAG: extracellular solute-binding protein [Gammaproteobacteria bacterium]|nr:extracellular solute-binding protein [Gammaproteobacteria bacterium]